MTYILFYFFFLCFLLAISGLSYSLQPLLLLLRLSLIIKHNTCSSLLVNLALCYVCKVEVAVLFVMQPDQSQFRGYVELCFVLHHGVVHLDEQVRGDTASGALGVLQHFGHQAHQFIRFWGRWCIWLQDIFSRIIIQRCL